MPPIEKSDIPLARRRPLTYAANFEPSGWKAAVPSPETTTQATTSQYEGATQASAIPIPPAATPAGISQIAPCRSDQRPKSGWTIDAEIADAEHQHGGERVREVELVVEERDHHRQRAAREVHRAWPLESAAIARPSIRSLTRPAYTAGGVG